MRFTTASTSGFAVSWRSQRRCRRPFSGLDISGRCQITHRWSASSGSLCPMDEWSADGRRIEVLVVRPAEPETNIDPDDQTGSGYRAGTPEAYGWREIQREASGPDERHRVLRVSDGTYATAEAAHQGAEKTQSEEPDLAGLPIVHIHR